MTNVVEDLEQKAGGNFKKRFCLCFSNTKNYFEIEARKNHRCNDDNLQIRHFERSATQSRNLTQ